MHTNIVKSLLKSSVHGAEGDAYLTVCKLCFLLKIHPSQSVSVVSNTRKVLYLEQQSVFCSFQRAELYDSCDCGSQFEKVNFDVTAARGRRSASTHIKAQIRQ